jgi:hypothetical protein
VQQPHVVLKKNGRNIMIRIQFAAFFGFTLVACGQKAPSSFINGRPIPESQAKTCTLLQSYIAYEAVTKGIADLGVTLTKQDEAAVRKTLELPPNAVEWNRVRAAFLPQALAEVYDQHQDPNQVYERELKPTGIGADEWALYLPGGPIAEQVNTPEGRAKLRQRYNDAANRYADPNFIDSVDVSRLAAKQKADAALDFQLGHQDPEHFGKDLLEMQKLKESGAKGFPTDLLDRLNAARQGWWANERSEMMRTASIDPELKKRCGL